MAATLAWIRLFPLVSNDRFVVNLSVVQKERRLKHLLPDGKHSFRH